jgi:uncharacterized membrane protein YedE/YeeE
VHDFTPIHAIVGGALIATSLAIMLIATGRIAGLSGIFAGFVGGLGRRFGGGFVAAERGDWAWRAWFVAGMMLVGGGFALAEPATFDAGARVPLWTVAASGVLVGLGTRASNGCTSGHGLCGMSRLSRRSLVATVTFFVFGVATATISGALVRSP